MDIYLRRTRRPRNSRDGDAMTNKLRKKKEPHRIPYDVWINSHLSIARHYGGCKLNGKTYKLDMKCKQEPNGKYKADLVEVL